MAQLTDPSYITGNMFDAVLQEKFYNNTDDQGVQEHARKMLELVRESRYNRQIISDVLHASKVSNNLSPQGIAEVGFTMGLQFGFEMALTCLRDSEV